MFASFKSCEGYVQSRRDDVVSILMVLVWWLNNQTLPWCSLEGDELFDLLDQKCKPVMAEQFVKAAPLQIRSAVKKALLLGFKEKPDYDGIN